MRYIILLIFLLSLTACNVENSGNFNGTIKTKLYPTDVDLPNNTKDYSNLNGNKEATLDFIDVGQGDSILITTPNKHYVLIDCGDNNYGDDVVNYLKGKGVTIIDALITTHPHADHIGGCDDVLKAFDILNIYDNGETATSDTYADYKNAFEGSYNKVNGKLQTTIDGVNFEFQDYLTLKDTNDKSIITTINGKVILMGDCEEECEKRIDLTTGIKILKVGHHGSDTSSSTIFLERLQPETCIISVGLNNKYNHPSNETLTRLGKYCTIQRTDQIGTIEVKI